MKKPYVKPGMYVENFALAQTIATDCDADQHQNLGSPTLKDGGIDGCGWRVGGKIIWLAEPSCNRLADSDTDMGGFCYDNPEGAFSIFANS